MWYLSFYLLAVSLSRAPLLASVISRRGRNVPERIRPLRRGTFCDQLKCILFLECPPVFWYATRLRSRHLFLFGRYKDVRYMRYPPLADPLQESSFASADGRCNSPEAAAGRVSFIRCNFVLLLLALAVEHRVGQWTRIKNSARLSAAART